MSEVAPHTEPLAPEAVAEHYRSVDSAPARYSIARPRSVALGFIFAFTAVATIALTGMTLLIHAGVFGTERDLVFASRDPTAAAVPVRVFLVSFFVVFASCLATDVWRRLLVIVELVGGLLAICLALDLVALAIYHLVSVRVPVVGQQVASTLVALCLFPFVLLANAQLPDAVELPPRGRIRWHAWIRLGVPFVGAFFVAAWVADQAPVLIDWMREWALLGGVGPGVFLVQQLFAGTTALIGLRIVARSRRQVFAPDVAVLIPAHNEGHDIADTIASVDAAGRHYSGHVHVYVVDNCSTDATSEVAAAAIADCDTVTGEVLQCDEPGKAIALNLGLAAIREDFVVRIDADTRIGDSCLDLALRHFATPDIGCVGGMPLPVTYDTVIDKVRLVEVLVRHGFFQVSLIGYDGVVGAPGMFVVYRAAALRAVGALVQGMNGEDTDICVRISTAGYRTITDPTAIYYSETPRTWAHLREQRVRWFRSIYHIAAHNRNALFNRHSMAGAVVLPFQLVNAARRAMLAPVLIFALLLLTVFGGTFNQLEWAPVLAVVLGMPMLVAIFVCLLWRRPRALLYLPMYLVFRVIRSYLTIAAALTLVLPPLRTRSR